MTYVIDRPLNVSPDQLASAGSYISREWGDYGYRIESIRQPLSSVAVFHVAHSDGSRFAVAVDRWSNARQLPDDMAARIDVIREMNASATTP